MYVKNIIVCSSKQNYCIDTFFLLHRILNHKKMDIESRIIYMQKFTSASSLLFQYRYEALGETNLQNKCIGSLRNKRFALSLFDLGKSKNIVDIFAKMQTEKVKKNTWQAFSCHPPIIISSSYQHLFISTQASSHYHTSVLICHTIIGLRAVSGPCLK